MFAKELPHSWNVIKAGLWRLWLSQTCEKSSFTRYPPFPPLPFYPSNPLMMFSLKGFHHLLTLLLLNVCVQALDVSISVQAPPGARGISPDHVSLSIEQDRWIEWIGSTSRNDFFFNSLDNLNGLAGVPPRIRIGGQSADVSNPDPSITYYNSYFDNSTLSSNMPYPTAFGMRTGTKFFSTLSYLPKNTKVVVGVNYGANDDLRAAIYIGQITTAFQSPAVSAQNIVLEAIELGNEPDRYGKDGNYFKSWDPKWSNTPSSYLIEWTNWVKNIAEVNLSGWQGPIVDVPFWTASVSTLAPRTPSWTAASLLSSNLIPSNIAGNVKTFSQHHYSGTACKGTTQDLQNLLSKSNIRAGLNVFKQDVTAVKAKGLNYVLGEANSFSCHGAAGVSDVGGSAIWALDYLLYASQIGISRIYFHNGLGFKFNFLQPTSLSRSTLDASALSPPSQPYIAPSYYAAIIAAEAIGSSGQTRIVEISTTADNVSGYAFYVGDKLSKAVFINSKPYLKKDASRDLVHVNVAFGERAGFGTIKRLFVPHADDTSGLTWGGITYETNDARPSGVSRVERFDASTGFDLRSTEVALISFDN